MSMILKRRSAAARTWIPAAGAIAAIAFALAGCGGSSGGQGGSAYGAPGSAKPTASAPAVNTTPAATGSAGASITLANSSLGRILIDSKGKTLYLFQADKGTASTCAGACTAIWPPLTTNGHPIAGAGISSSKLGTTKRSDGATEVTYNGHPLYTYAGDSSPGMATGEGNLDFGAEWDVVSAAGNKIDAGK